MTRNYFHPVYWRFIPKIQVDLWLKDKDVVFDSYGVVIDVGWLCFSWKHVWEWGGIDYGSDEQ